VTPLDLPFEEIWLHDFEFVPQPVNVRMLSAWQLMNCAPGGHFVFGATSSASSRPTEQIVACCSSASWLMLNALVT
jgi:hypothetical protein